MHAKTYLSGRELPLQPLGDSIRVGIAVVIALLLAEAVLPPPVAAAVITRPDVMTDMNGTPTAPTATMIAAIGTATTTVGNAMTAVTANVSVLAIAPAAPKTGTVTSRRIVRDVKTTGSVGRRNATPSLMAMTGKVSA